MKKVAPGFLQGILILDLADEHGSFCSRLLADLGAKVIKIEKQKRFPSRNSASFQYHNANKRSLTLDLHAAPGRRLFHRLVQKADVLVETFPPGHLASLESDYARLKRINRNLIHLSITGFGRRGSRSVEDSSEFLLAARGGQMFFTRDSSGKPVKLAGSQTAYSAALFGANAILLALRRRKQDGQGSFIDLSMQEAAVSMLGLAVINDGENTSRAGSATGRDSNDSFYALRCRNGHILIPVFRDIDTILELAGSKGIRVFLTANQLKSAQRGEIPSTAVTNALEPWTSQFRKEELSKLGQTMGLPWAPVESIRDVLKSPQLKARRFFTHAKSKEKSRGFCMPGPPYKFSSGPQPRPAPIQGWHTHELARILGSFQTSGSTNQVKIKGPVCPDSYENTLKGIRVLDFTRMLSGPYACRVLGDFGAEVIKVQSRHTASGAEKNDSPFFRSWNRNKKSIRLDLGKPEARNLILELVSISDVVVENFSPRVLSNWDLTYKTLSSVKRDLILASISAMGQIGPWKNHTGFAPTFHALSGLMAETCLSQSSPADIGFPYGDLVAGLYAVLAILASLEHRDRTGKGQYIDLSAYEAVCTLLGPAFATAEGAEEHSGEPPPVKRLPIESTCGCYPCSGKDRWCAISIHSEAEWRALCKISGIAELKHTRHCFPPEARERRDEIFRRIATWTAGLPAESLVRRLKRAGIAAAVVQNVEDLARDPQLAARNFFTVPPHSRFDRLFSDRSALWAGNRRPVHWRDAPDLGEHNHYVFAALLGHSEDELKLWTKNGVFD
jgi:crotonobetainyl-CoA:carnitine CoA-transferase CaiB-like acyl-CoA transferase